MPYFSNAYLTVHEAPLPLFQVCMCACFLFPSAPKATETIVRGHLAALFLEVYTVLVNFFEFSIDASCLWQKVCETESVSRSALVVVF